MFECRWQRDGFECWELRGDLRGASRRWQHRLGEELWLWLNAAGEGVVWGREHRIFLKPGLFGCFGAAETEAWKWTRLPGTHQGRILVIPRAFVQESLAAATTTAHAHADTATAAVPPPPRTARWLRGEAGLSFAALMGSRERRLLELLAAADGARPLPAPLRRALAACLRGWLLTQPRRRMPRAAARGRSRSRNQVSRMKPASHQGQ